MSPHIFCSLFFMFHHSYITRNTAELLALICLYPQCNRFRCLT